MVTEIVTVYRDGMPTESRIEVCGHGDRPVDDGLIEVKGPWASDADAEGIKCAVLMMLRKFLTALREQDVMTIALPDLIGVAAAAVRFMMAEGLIAYETAGWRMVWPPIEATVNT